MRKRIFSLIAIAILAVGTGWYLKLCKDKSTLSDLSILNIEALANSEQSEPVYRIVYTGNGYYVCYFGGNTTCS